MRRKAYHGIGVNDVVVERLLEGKAGEAAVVGVDMGKHKFLSVCRWGNGAFERPWRVSNPSEIGAYVRLLQRVGQGRKLVVAMESSGTYGDSLRQALADAGIGLERVSGKAAHDYAEIFDGVPSQHDGKDAAIVAELASLGKSVAWAYQGADEWEQELGYGVDWLVAQRQLLGIWQGRLEGLLGRHWPEATRVLKLSSVTLLRALSHYGSPQAMAADGEAAARLRKWGGKFLKEAKIERLLAAARTSVGVRLGAWESRRLQRYAEEALAARREGKRGERQVRRLAEGHAVLEAQGKVVGVPTACVLWVHTGDPRQYYAAGAYRKALGLNLVERSSGAYESGLHISKRGSARSRQWLYFAALRQVQQAGVRGWYEAKKARDPQGALRVVVALMRKLALALYQVGVHQQAFNVRRLFAQVVSSAQSEPQDIPR
jgi:transposase